MNASMLLIEMNIEQKMMHSPLRDLRQGHGRVPLRGPRHRWNRTGSQGGLMWRKPAKKSSAWRR
jgi:hypothetical protein